MQVGRTGMDSGADAEISSLLDLPSSAPGLWTMLSSPQSKPAHAKSQKMNKSFQDITANAHVPALR